MRQPTEGGGDSTTAVVAAVGDQTTDGGGGGQEQTTAAGRTGRRYYQPGGAVQGYAYQSVYPQRRAYKGPGQSKKRPLRSKPVRRRPSGPRRRPAASPSMAGGRYFRRLPPRALRGPPNNYIDSPPPVVGDYEDDDDGTSFEPSSVSPFDYGEYRDVDREPAYAPYIGPMAAMPAAVVVASPPFGRQRKRPLTVTDEPPQAVVHVPVRVQARPVADPMEKLRQMVHEAMDEHFANKHRELYVDGFNVKPAVYSAKYKRQQQQEQAAAAAADKDKKQQRSATAMEAQNDAAAAGKKSDAAPASDADADGTDDRLTLAEISAYMGAKPAETVLSAGGHRYVLSDALQHAAYRQQQQQLHHRQPQQLHQQQQQYDADDASYLRYVSPPFETIYGLPAARWAYK